MLDDLLKRVNVKKDNVSSTEDKEKINVILELLDDPKLFIALDVETIFGILEFLGFSKSEAIKVYKELVSPKMNSNSDECLSFENSEDDLNFKLQ